MSRRLAELEVVDVAEHDDLGRASTSQDRSTKPRTSVACWCRCTSRGAHRRLEAAEERVVAALGVEVVGDHEHRLAVRTVNSPTSGLRELVHAALVGSIRPGEDGQVRLGAAAATTVTARRGRCPRAGRRSRARGRCGRGTPGGCCRPAGRRRCRRPGRSSAPRTPGRRPPGSPPISLPIVAVGDDGAVVGRAVVVLDLLQRQDVRALQVGDDLPGQPVELGLRVGRREVLDVERRDGEVVVALGVR